jgi:MoaA/NifB/PqqE/SkfB family radical SAM enzyme
MVSYAVSTLRRIIRHIRLSAHAHRRKPPTPPFLIVFINSICNQTCEHCFYWRNLNRPDDLTFDEFKALSKDLGRVENLNLSGGEPFLRKDFAEICRLFIRNNGVKQIYVPTNGSFRGRTLDAIRGVLQEPGLQLFAVELSLDGMPEFHDRFRGMKDAFERAMDTYDGLAALQREDARLRIHAISTVTSINLSEVRRLTEYLFKRCPAMDHHNLALIRGDRKNPSLTGPLLQDYRQLYDHIKAQWRPREEGRFGAIVEPMLQWAKTKTAEEQRQVIPCRAGWLSGVVYANGDVSLCETHPPLGNLRKQSFTSIWNSPEAVGLRDSIRNKECWCTNEVFLWPSIVFQPVQLARTLVQSRPWAEGKLDVNGSLATKAADPAKLRVLE